MRSENWWYSLVLSIKLQNFIKLALFYLSNIYRFESISLYTLVEGNLFFSYGSGVSWNTFHRSVVRSNVCVWTSFTMEYLSIIMSVLLTCKSDNGFQKMKWKALCQCTNMRATIDSISEICIHGKIDFVAFHSIIFVHSVRNVNKWFDVLLNCLLLMFLFWFLSLSLTIPICMWPCLLFTGKCKYILQFFFCILCVLLLGIW